MGQDVAGAGGHGAERQKVLGQEVGHRKLVLMLFL